MSRASQITWESLSSFLKNPSAPQGYAYLLNGDPAIQLDLFEKFYTLFWLGHVEVAPLLNMFGRIIDDHRFMPPLLPGSDLTGTVSVVRKCRKTLDRDYFIKEEQPLTYSLNQPGSVIQDRINTFIQPHSEIIIAIHIELKTKVNGRDYELTLWADTGRSPKLEKEAGLTSNLPVTEGVEEFLAQTSLPVRSLPLRDFERLVDVIKNHISERGYDQ